MLLIPAIDIKDGQCVRLRQGIMEDKTVFSDDPVSMASRWIDAGARRIHIVDLDGAVQGKPVNKHIVQAICERYPDVPIQLGGGIRDKEAIRAYLEAGVDFCILGSKAVKDPHFVREACEEFPGQIIVGLDVKDDRVAVQGWAELSTHSAEELAKQFENDGVAAIVFTDISKDGMMKGTNVESTVALARKIQVPVIASGGVTTLQDINALMEVRKEGIGGAIIGRALYEGTIDLKEAQALVDSIMAEGN